MQFRPLCKIGFYVFIANLIILMQLGAKHVESPFIEFGQISTTLYFLYFLFLMLSFTFLENTFLEARLNAEVTSQKEYSEVTHQYSFNRLLHSGFINTVTLQIIVCIIYSAKLIYYLFGVYVWPDTLLFLDTISESMFTMYNFLDLGSYDLLPKLNLEIYNIESSNLVEIVEFDNQFIDTQGWCIELASEADITGDDSDGDIYGEPSDPVPGRRCPNCLEKGVTTWVIPGTNCPICNTPVN